MFLENNQVRQFHPFTVLAWTAVVAWMGLIFFLSQQTGEQSGGLSNQIADSILRVFGQKDNSSLLNSFESMLRVIAHGSAFFGLAILVSIAFRQIQIIDLPNGIITLIFCLLYAASDEWHQSFVPGRSNEWSDFFTDGAGIILAILILQVFWAVRRVNSALKVDL